ncbi:hypothetical protein [Mesorhizobium loti]|uniref:hypothetical protein n=1 Tax=Rhizobium loti TaxID=381 RepID=UPI001AEBAC2F|nr:hypothetical protein [Mesorhizobium loti]
MVESDAGSYDWSWTDARLERIRDRIAQAGRAVPDREAITHALDVAGMGELETPHHVGDRRL